MAQEIELKNLTDTLLSPSIMRFIIASVVLLSALLSASCSTSSISGSTAGNIKMSKEEGDLAVTVWNDVNRYRQQAGKRPMELHHGLTLAAQQHAEYLAANDGIVLEAGRKFSNVSQKIRHDYNMNEVTGRTYGGRPVSSDAIHHWTADKADEAYLLGAWTHSGVGVSNSPFGETHVVLVIANRKAGGHRAGPSIGF